MDVSMIVSSFNQKTRLNFCLQSLQVQELNFNWEVILADDNSTDGTLDMVAERFPFVKISKNNKSESGVYTLADNWNAAAKLATGKRLVFSNADMVYSKYFLAAHMDPIMQDSIIFGPGYCSKPKSIDYINNVKSVDKLVKFRMVLAISIWL
jgi:glycosyltransferase involved in cell wall biosynthesis